MHWRSGFVGVLLLAFTMGLQAQVLERPVMENAQDQILSGNWKEAKYWLNEARKESQNGFLPDAWMGMAMLQEGNQAEAEKFFGLAIRQAKLNDPLRPDQLEGTMRVALYKLYLTAGLASVGQKDFVKGARELSLAITANPAEVRGYYERGVAYASANRFAEAEKDFLKALELDPKLFLAATNLGLLYYKASDFKRAEQYYRKSEQLKPGNPQNLFGLGNIYYRIYQDDEKAIAHFRAAIEHNPNMETAWTNMRIALKRQNDLQKRIKLYEGLYNLAPYRFDLNKELGIYYASTTDTAKARTLLNKALKINANDGGSLVAIGTMKVAQQQYESAIKVLDRAIQADPKNPYGWFNRGVAYHKLNRFPEAERDFQQAGAIDPNLVQKAANR